MQAAPLQPEIESRPTAPTVVLDPAPEPLFDRLVRSAAYACRAPIALLTIVDEDRQWFKAAFGVGDVRETPRAHSFCAHTLLRADAFLHVADLSQDPRFATNPFVVGPRQLRFYAGAVIALGDGARIGALCVLDHRPRTLDDAQIATLGELAATAAAAFDARLHAARDPRGSGRRPPKPMSPLVPPIVPLLVPSAHRPDDARTSTTVAATASDATFDRLGPFAGFGGWTLQVGANEVAWSAQTCRLHDRPQGHRPSVDEALSYFTAPGRATIGKAVRQAIEHGTAFDLELPCVSASGRPFWARVAASVEFDDRARPLRIVGLFQDVTTRKRSDDELVRIREVLGVTLTSIHDAVVCTDIDGAIDWMNAAAERMTGWLQADAIGLPFDDVCTIVDERSRGPAQDPISRCLADDDLVGAARRVLLIARDRTEYAIEQTVTLLRDAQSKPHGALLVLRDVSEKRRLHDERSHRASYDLLTGLFNRAEFERRLSRSLAGRTDDSASGVLLYLDLDRFRVVNEACGHAAGDQLLRQVASVIRGCVRAQDFVARLGGDEFGILLEGGDVGQAEQCAQALCDELDAFRFVHEGRRFRVGASIGLVSIDGRWTGLETLLQAADASCYAAKQAGRNRVHAWFESDEAVEARRDDLAWVSRMELALDEDRFELFGQRIDPIDGHAHGLHFEVLLRMRESDGRRIGPGLFLPVAERFHIAGRIDRWVVRNALDWMHRAEDDGARIDMMAVNLSGQSFGDRAFRHEVCAMLRTATFDLRKLCFEVTETAAITHLAEARTFIDEMRAFGVKIALDDFGAGASSFGYLKSLAVDFLKIDGHFIKHLLEDGVDNAAVRCFVEVAKVVGVRTIAEFVERADVRDALREIGVDMAQGYLIHQPEPLDALLSSARRPPDDAFDQAA